MGGGPATGGAVNGGGARVEVEDERGVNNLKNGKDVKGVALPDPWEYETSLLCPQNLGPTNEASEVNCMGATYGCPAGTGPLTQIWGRPLNPDGTPKPNAAGSSPWQRVDTTCFPDAVPGQPTISMAMIRNAFHDTAFAKATISTQPTGDVTLVNLKTYYQTNWAAGGFQPGEADAIDPATMLGYRVEIRPTLVSYVYDFGDGSRSEPTTSPGGVYPDGDVTHTYTQRGAFSTRVEVTFGGEFRLNGGDWIPIDDTVVVPMPGTTVTVKEARAVLVND